MSFPLHTPPTRLEHLDCQAGSVSVDPEEVFSEKHKHWQKSLQHVESQNRPQRSAETWDFNCRNSMRFVQKKKMKENLKPTQTGSLQSSSAKGNLLGSPFLTVASLLSQPHLVSNPKESQLHPVHPTETAHARQTPLCSPTQRFLLESHLLAVVYCLKPQFYFALVSFNPPSELVHSKACSAVL